MIYRLRCLVPHPACAGKTEERVFTFDNRTMIVRNDLGEEIDFSKDERFAHIGMPPKEPPAEPFSPSEPLVGKSRKIRVLKLQLGLGCNYHCRYCLQRDWRSHSLKAPDKGTAERFFAALEREGYELDPNGIVELWGGEPFVYWKTMRELLPKLRAKFGWKNEIKVVTNGSLLTDEIVDELIQYRVSVIISHDGPGFSLRDDVDPLTIPEKKAVWLRLCEKAEKKGLPFSFHTVLTPVNSDLMAIRRFFDEKFKPGVLFGIEGIVSYSGSREDCCQFTAEEAGRLDASIWEALIKNPGTVWALEREADEMLLDIVRRQTPDRIFARCNNGKKRILICDLEGNALSCQSRSANFFTIGNIHEPENITNRFFTHWSKRPWCSNCLVLNLCRGGCPHSDPKEFATSCRNEFIYYTAIFSAVWFRLTGTILKNAEPLGEAAKHSRE